MRKKRNVQRMKFLIYWHTIRNLKARQIIYRIVFRIKKAMGPGIIGRRISRLHYASRPAILNLKNKCFAESAVQNLARRRFKFLNTEAIFSKDIAWNDPAKSKLWLYNLHYFEYLLPLTRDVSAENFETAKEILAQWLHQNRVGQGPGWEPYPLSLRIVNWIFFYDAYRRYFENDPSFEAHFLQGLYRQTAYLRHFFEYHLQANHLWVNAKALLAAGLFFAERPWIVRGLRCVRQQLKEQILSDGGHYERSPMYHALILTDVLDLLNVIRALHAAAAEIPPEIQSLQNELQDTAQRMWRYLQGLTQPDGKLPLFGDTAHGIAPMTDEIGRYLRAIGAAPSSSPDATIFRFVPSGYYIYRDADYYLMVDGGELGVRYQPGHAHCDFLSYEFSFKGQRFIVDSGVGEYLPTDLRRRARSIYSHNTVVVNGLDQAELWSAFRMGRHIRPQKVNVPNEGTLFFEGAYSNTLNRRLAYRHQRLIRLEGGIVVEDRIRGRRIQSVENLLHVHPACRIEMARGKILLERNAVRIALNFDSREMQAEIRDWFYVPEFGKVLPAKMIVLRPRPGVKEMRYVLGGVK